MAGPEKAVAQAVVNEAAVNEAAEDLAAGRHAEILGELGYDAPLPGGAFYLWVPAADAWDAARDLARRAGIVVSSGEFYGAAGADHFRVAVVQPDHRIELVASRVGL